MTGRVQKRAQQGHARIKQGAWPDIIPEQKTIPKKKKKKKILKGIASIQRQTLSGEVADGKKKSRQGHARKKGGTWPGMQRGYRTNQKRREEEEEEEYAAMNIKQLARNPVGGNQDWENENEPTLGPSTLGIHGGRTGRFTKQATTLPEEVNKKMRVKKQEY